MTGLIRRRLAQRHGDERGAMLVFVIMLALVLFVTAALAVDIAKQVAAKQGLENTLDAAAHAGAYQLPGDGAGAKAAAIAMAKQNDPNADPTVDLWCIVASNGASKTPKTSQIPSTCNPGPAPYTSSGYPGLVCNTKICAIPCKPEEGDSCNSIRVADSDVVPFDFAPVAGYEEGNTGSRVSVACKGPCGTEVPNPMDVVVMADRTPSMSDANRGQMVSGIKSMLQTMDPTMQYVALGTLHKSTTSPTNGCATQDTHYTEGATAGSWVPVKFSNDYHPGLVAPPATPTLNGTSALVKGLTCLPMSSRGGFRTELAAGMKGAARYLLGYTPNNLSSLPARPNSDHITKAIIFETDGMPEETFTGGSTSLTATGDVAAGYNYYNNDNGIRGCENFKEVARQAKEKGILIVTIGFGSAADGRCVQSAYPDGSTTTAKRGPFVRDYLAAAASKDPVTGNPSVADSACTTTAQRAVENSDGDYYFCAATGSELGPIFKTAMAQLSKSVRLVAMPTG